MNISDTSTEAQIELNHTLRRLDEGKKRELMLANEALTPVYSIKLLEALRKVAFKYIQYEGGEPANELVLALLGVEQGCLSDHLRNGPIGLIYRNKHVRWSYHHAQCMKYECLLDSPPSGVGHIYWKLKAFGIQPELFEHLEELSNPLVKAVCKPLKSRPRYCDESELLQIASQNTLNYIIGWIELLEQKIGPQAKIYEHCDIARYRQFQASKKYWESKHRFWLWRSHALLRLESYLTPELIEFKRLHSCFYCGRLYKKEAYSSLKRRTCKGCDFNEVMLNSFHPYASQYEYTFSSFDDYFSRNKILDDTQQIDYVEMHRRFEDIMEIF